MTRSCLVIGGGISGMSAALLLARQGLKVRLVEKAPRLAPLVRGFCRQGLRFNTGFHHTSYLEPGEILERAFRLMGVTGFDTYPLGQNKDQRILFRHDGSSYAMPSGFSNVLETLGEVFPSERSSLSRYLTLVATMQSNSLYLAPRSGTDAPPPEAQSSLSEVLDSYFQDTKLKALMASQTLFHGVGPDEVLFAFHAMVGAAPLRSLHGIKGGGVSLVQAFERALVESDVDISIGSGVERIVLSSAGSFKGIRLENGSDFQADACVATMHPGLLKGMVPAGSLRPAYTRRITSMAETPRATMLFGALSTSEDISLGSSWLSLPGTNPHDWLKPSTAADSGSIFVGVSSLCGTTGRVGLDIAACDTGLMPSNDRTDNIWQLFQASLPQLADQTTIIDCAAPSTFARFTNSPHGSYYGPKHSLDYPSLQPRTKIPGVFLAGQAIVAPGVAGAVISACIAADVLLGSNAVLEDLSTC